ncbi:MAG: Hsp33 family molecular chaperone HslO [Blastochloris sp.]|nr:Hsp33 family molecular chaperone HslO [Blastochloris sp.]
MLSPLFLLRFMCHNTLVNPTPDLPSPPEISLQVRSYYIRERNALVTQAEFSDLFVDYYLHLADLHVQQDPEHDRIFKETLAALTLHCASKPWNETIAWTLSFQNPQLNIFVNGSNPLGTLIGRCFTENIRPSEKNLFFADIVRPNQLPHRSSIQFDGADGFKAVEAYYKQSEQRPAHFFEVADEEYLFVSAQPDCDVAWLESLTLEQAQNLEQNEVFSLLEMRNYRWECGCTHEKMMDILAPTMRSDAGALFGGDAALRMTCPRCGKRYAITRESMEALIKK